MDYVPLPRFSSDKLAIWFAQLESVFALNGILTDSDKYNYVVTQIPPEFCSLVEDILLNPPPESKYDHIKYEFIKRMSIHHLKKELLGNDTPSKYLKRLTKLANTRVPIEIILNIWLSSLPEQVRDIVSLDVSTQIEIIGPMADKVMALLKPVPPQSNDQLSLQQFEVISKRVDEVTKELKILQLMLDGEDIEEQQLLGKQGQSHVISECSIQDKVDVDKSDQQKVFCCYHNIVLRCEREICAACLSKINDLNK